MNVLGRAQALALAAFVSLVAFNPARADVYVYAVYTGNTSIENVPDSLFKYIDACPANQQMRVCLT